MNDKTFVNTKKESNSLKTTKTIVLGTVFLSICSTVALFSHHPNHDNINVDVDVKEVQNIAVDDAEMKLNDALVRQKNAINQLKIEEEQNLKEYENYAAFLNNYFNLWNNDVLSNKKMLSLTLPQNKNFDGEIRDNNGLLTDIKLLNHNHELMFDTHYKTENQCQNVIYNSLYNQHNLEINHIKIKSIMISYGKTNSYFSAQDLKASDINNQISNACHLNTPDTYFQDSTNININTNQAFINNTHLVVDYEKVGA